MFSQSRRGPSPGWKCLQALSHLRHYVKPTRPLWPLRRRPKYVWVKTRYFSRQIFFFWFFDFFGPIGHRNEGYRHWKCLKTSKNTIFRAPQISQKFLMKIWKSNFFLWILISRVFFGLKKCFIPFWKPWDLYFKVLMSFGVLGTFRGPK